MVSDWLLSTNVLGLANSRYCTPYGVGWSLLHGEFVESDLERVYMMGSFQVIDQYAAMGAAGLCCSTTTG